jgi:hypothetical protein
MREFIDQPALSNDLHPCAGIRDELSAKIKLKIAMSQSRERIPRVFDAPCLIRGFNRRFYIRGSFQKFSSENPKLALIKHKFFNMRI